MSLSLDTDRKMPIEKEPCELLEFDTIGAGVSS